MFETELLELTKAVLEWWKDHEYDTVMVGGNEYNVFDETPQMVEIAKVVISEIGGYNV